MKLSIVIPAYNEEQRLPGCLASVAAALAELGESSLAAGLEVETIVCDNNSRDRTAAVARAGGAHVVFEPVNQISRARNAGAAAATGEWLLFLDADSHLHPATFRELLETLRADDCAGGGCVIALDYVPLWGRPLLATWNALSRFCHWAAGSFVFCRRATFVELGGFSLDLFAAEEIEFCQRLKAWGSTRGEGVVILARQPHLSSGRKFQLYSFGEQMSLIFRTLVGTRRTLGKREALDFFYDGRR